MIWRFSRAAAIAACSVSVLSAAACSSSSSSTSSSSPAPSATDSYHSMIARQDQLYPVFVGCLAQHNIPVWSKSTGNVSVAAQGTSDGWYANGTVTQNAAFYRWIDSHDGMYPMSPGLKPDQTIIGWVQNAAVHGTWPASVCGPLPAA